MYIRWTSDGLGAWAGRFSPLVPPRNLGGCPRVEGDAVAAALDGPAPPSSRGWVRGAPIALRPRPVFGGMVDKYAFGVTRGSLLEGPFSKKYDRRKYPTECAIMGLSQICCVLSDDRDSREHKGDFVLFWC